MSKKSQMQKYARHHIHVKCGDDFFVISHRDNEVIELSVLMDNLVKYCTEGVKNDCNN